MNINYSQKTDIDVIILFIYSIAKIPGIATLQAIIMTEHKNILVLIIREHHR